MPIEKINRPTLALLRHGVKFSQILIEMIELDGRGLLTDANRQTSIKHLADRINAIQHEMMLLIGGE